MIGQNCTERNIYLLIFKGVVSLKAFFMNLREKPLKL